MQDYLREVKAPAASDIANIRILMGAPFAFCSRLVNGLRDQVLLYVHAAIFHVDALFIT